LKKKKMKVDIQLYSVLREKLPIDARGRTVLELEDGSTIEDLLIKLDIERKVVISVNGVQEPDKTRLLQDGDKIKLFSSVSGG
jgi:sulfur carrier protein ThiS